MNPAPFARPHSTAAIASAVPGLDDPSIPASHAGSSSALGPSAVFHIASILEPPKSWSLSRNRSTSSGTPSFPRGELLAWL